MQLLAELFKHTTFLIADRPVIIDVSDAEDVRGHDGHVDGQDRRSDDNTSYVDLPSDI